MSLFQPESKTQAVIAISCAFLMAVAVYAIRLTLVNPDLTGTRLRYQEAGAVMAEETAKLIGKQGKIVVVTSTDQTARAGSLDSMLTGLRKSLRQLGRYEIVATEMVDNPSETDPGVYFTLDVLNKIMTQHPDVAAIVSLAAAPQLKAEDLKHLPATMPKIVVLGLPAVNLKPMLAANIIQAAIVPQAGLVPGHPAPAKTEHPSFDATFQVAHPEDAAVVFY
jgi:hypothetical protein